ncbi:MAG: LamG-like jellyroll fold domain-containing protein [Armatimonadota bacterium]|nr:LamG-like jellyroll fold domain-containing protein [Armatimonadota bacterium]
MTILLTIAPVVMAGEPPIFDEDATLRDGERKLGPGAPIAVMWTHELLRRRRLVREPNMRRSTVALLLVTSSVACVAQGDALLFRASFDEDLTADEAHGQAEPVWAREGTTTVEGGVSGTCAEVRPGGNLTYDAPGNAYWERGTLSFWWQCVEPVGRTEFTVATVGSLDHFYYGRWYRLYCSGGRLYAYLIDWHFDLKRAMISSGDLEPQQGEWYHLAMAWDATRGIGLYVNGELMRQSGTPFYMPVHLNQIGLGMSAVAHHAKSGALRQQRFDEVRSYDRWLSDEQIAALARGEDVRDGPELDEDEIAQHRIQSLALDSARGLPVAPRDGRALVVTQPRIVTARDVLRTQMTGVDGKLASKWPSGRRYRAEGHRYDIEMAGEPVNYVALTGTMRGKLQLVADGDATVPLHREDGDPMVVRAVLDEPMGAEEAHVLREVSEDPSERRKDGAMADLQVLNVTPEMPAEAIRPSQRWALADLGDLGDVGARIRSEYPPRDQLTLAPGSGQRSVQLPAMRMLHIVSGPAEERTGVRRVRLGLSVNASSQTVAHLELIHPLSHTRRQMILDLSLADGGTVELVLDPRDLILEPGQRIHLTLQFAQPVQLEDCLMALDEAPVATAAEEYVPDQRRMLKAYFMGLSEARPWGWPREKIKLLDQLFTCMEQLRELVPDDRDVRAYYHWTHYWEPKPRVELEPPPEGVPEWAWYQVKVLEKCRQVAHWWIDNRQVETGEFGSNDGPNDDSVLVQDWLALYLMGEHDRKLVGSARRVADMCWERTMTDGINNQVTDPLHAYEWGANVNTMMAVMDYGNPVYIERMMQMCQHLDELTGVNPRGHRHYRSNRYGLHDIVTEGRYGWDTTSNALNMQAAALLAWYSGNPSAKRYLTQWLDAWLEDLVDPEDGKGRACTVRFETGEKRAERLTSYGFETLMAGAFHLTGEQRYADGLPLIWECDRRHYERPIRSMNVAQQILRHTDREDFRENLREAIAEVELWESPIRYTDDRPELKYLQWLMTGDTAAVTEALKAMLSDLTWEMPMYTTAEQSPDRLWLPQPLLNHMRLGDVAMLRNRIYPQHWVSWGCYPGSLAVWVLEKSPTHLKMWLVNVSEFTTRALMSLWRLERGEYEVLTGEDADENGEFDDQPKRLRWPVDCRRQWVGVELPPRRVMLVELRRAEALGPAGDRPDLAIGPGDLRVDPESGLGVATVHNIGGGDAGPFEVKLSPVGGWPERPLRAVGDVGADEERDDPRMQARVHVPGLPAPQGFEPSTIEVRFEGLDLREHSRVGIVVTGGDHELWRPNDGRSVTHSVPDAMARWRQ